MAGRSLSNFTTFFKVFRGEFLIILFTNSFLHRFGRQYDSDKGASGRLWPPYKTITATYHNRENKLQHFICESLATVKIGEEFANSHFGELKIKNILKNTRFNLKIPEKIEYKFFFESSKIYKFTRLIIKAYALILILFQNKIVH